MKVIAMVYNVVFVREMCARGGKGMQCAGIVFPPQDFGNSLSLLAAIQAHRRASEKYLGCLYLCWKNFHDQS
jgi:hypothetical protein